MKKLLFYFLLTIPLPLSAESMNNEMTSTAVDTTGKETQILTKEIETPTIEFTKLSEVLSSFIKFNDNTFQYSLHSKKSSGSISIDTYVFNSQKWPLDKHRDIPSTIWKHKLVLYIPSKIEYSKVLLYVAGGQTYDDDGVELNFAPPKEFMDYKEIALKNNAIVAELQDVPNQHLKMGDSWIKEDAYLAYTYKKFLENPLNNAYLPGHLPMAKAVVKAMDVIQHLVNESTPGTNPHFVLAGASKRAWAVWLASLEDKRVDAIIPIVLDVLNTQQSILHICQIHKGCPYALKDYKDADLIKKIPSDTFADLMKIEDPFMYLGMDYDRKYKERLSIPKLLIQASGDDFFVPDSSHFYFKQLPGKQNYIRYLPNSLHYFMGNPISDSTNSRKSIQKALENYFGFHLKQTELPSLEWKHEKNMIEIQSSVTPSKVLLWTAFNENQDFRYLQYHFQPYLWWKKLQSFFTKKLCNTCYESQELKPTCTSTETCKIEAKLLPSPTPTWRASFVEVFYEIDGSEFVISSEVFIDSLSSKQ